MHISNEETFDEKLIVEPWNSASKLNLIDFCNKIHLKIPSVCFLNLSPLSKFTINKLRDSCDCSLQSLHNFNQSNQIQMIRIITIFSCDDRGLFPVLWTHWWSSQSCLFSGEEIKIWRKTYGDFLMDFDSFSKYVLIREGSLEETLVLIKFRSGFDSNLHSSLI